MQSPAEAAASIPSALWEFSAAWTEEVKDKISQGCDVLTGLVLTGKKRKTLGGPRNSQYMIIFIDPISPWQSRKPPVVGRRPASMRYQRCSQHQLKGVSGPRHEHTDLHLLSQARVFSL